MSEPRRPGGGELWRRRDVFRRIRREVLAQDPQTDLRTFLSGAARPLVEETGARACAMVMRFQEATRDLLVLVPREGLVLRRLRPLDPEEKDRDLASPSGGEAGSGFSLSELDRMAERLELAPGRILQAPVVGSGGAVARVELLDPDPAILPDALVLRSLLGEVAAVFELAFLYARLRREKLETRLLQAVGQELGRSLELDQLLNSILDLLRQVVPYDAAAIFLLGEEQLEVVHQSVRGYGDATEEQLQLKVGQGIVGWSAKTGHPQIVPDVHRDPRYVDSRPATRSEMVAPLRSGGKTLGVFNLEDDRLNAYSPHDLEMLMSFAGHAAVAIERARFLEEMEAKRRLEQELRIARRIQRFFVPKPSPSLRARGVAGRTVSSLEVSGDYFDFIERADGSLVLAVADVSGKGIPAALIGSSLRAALRLAAGRGDDPAPWCVELNDFLVSSLRDTEFVTGFFAWTDAAQRVVRFCNAGHNPPLLLRRSGEVEWLETGGTILGGFRGLTYESAAVELGPDDLLVIYTDGVTEAFSPEDEEFGQEGLLRVVREHREEDSRTLSSRVVRAVRDFVEGDLPDDLTVVVMRGRSGEEDR